MPKCRVQTGRTLSWEREVRLEAIGPVQDLCQFLRRFVAKGIANNDEDFAVLRFVQPAFHMSLVELVLIRHLVRSPALQETR